MGLYEVIHLHHHLRVIKLVFSHLSTHFFAVSLNLLRSSNEQSCARRVHCIMCAVFSVARPHSQVVSPSYGVVCFVPMSHGCVWYVCCYVRKKALLQCLQLLRGGIWCPCLCLCWVSGMGTMFANLLTIRAFYGLHRTSWSGGRIMA